MIDLLKPRNPHGLKSVGYHPSFTRVGTERHHPPLGILLSL